MKKVLFYMIVMALILANSIPVIELTAEFDESTASKIHDDYEISIQDYTASNDREQFDYLIKHLQVFLETKFKKSQQEKIEFEENATLISLEKFEDSLNVNIDNKIVELNYINGKDQESANKIEGLSYLEENQSANTKANAQFEWPTVSGTITTYQGMRWGEYHNGIDIISPNHTISAAAKGVVIFTGWRNGYGNTIRIDHRNGYITQYAHLNTITVNEGETVLQGSKIGIMGSTGFSTGVHLDFEVYYNGEVVNPLDVLP